MIKINKIDIAFIIIYVKFLKYLENYRYSENQLI